MLNKILTSGKNLLHAFTGLPTPKKIITVGTLVVLLVSLGYAFYLVNKKEYATLYAGLEGDDLAKVVEALKARKVPYQLAPNNAVAVPKDQLYEVRLELAAKGIPDGSGTGFEIFDKQALGSTRFVQKINYQRALQGELSRTINQLDEVLESRVHLAIPEEPLFMEEKKPARAAVVVKLRPGAQLGQWQIQGIVNLVVGAVDGLQDEGVNILSTDGRVLFKKDGEDASYSLSNLQMEYKNRLEEGLHTKVQSMLQQVLGSDKVITRVAADLDFNKTQVSEETFDPDSAVVRSQQRSIESAQGKNDAARGNPDAPINIKGQLMQDAPPGQAKSKEFEKQRETINYEVSHVNRQTVQAPGRISKLSVAVIIDGRYEMKAGTNNQMERVFVGRTPQELKAYEDLAKKAAGLDEARGDQLTLSNIPFVTDASELEAAPAQNKYLKILKDNQKSLLNAVLLALLFLFVIKPLMKTLGQVARSTTTTPNDLETLPAAETEGNTLMLGSQLPGPAQGINLRQQAAALVQHDSDRASEIIRGWMNEGER